MKVTLTLLLLMACGHTVKADELFVEDFAFVRGQAAVVKQASVSLDKALAEADFDLFKKTVNELRSTVENLEKISEKFSGNTLDKASRGNYTNEDQRWWYDNVKNVYWRYYYGRIQVAYPAQRAEAISVSQQGFHLSGSC